MPIHSWDVAALDSSGKATWPQHTEKCSGVGEERVCLEEDEEDEEDDEPSSIGYPKGMFKDLAPEGVDFVLNRTNALAAARRSVLGWQKRLRLDEFPLEIQCRRCFW